MTIKSITDTIQEYIDTEVKIQSSKYYDKLHNKINRTLACKIRMNIRLQKSFYDNKKLMSEVEDLKQTIKRMEVR